MDEQQDGRKLFACPHFDGPAYKRENDHERLSTQHLRVKGLMLDGCWRTLQEIAAITLDPVSSISAQLRHLRKPRFGSFIVERRWRGKPENGIYEYRVRRRVLP